ncbi:MAG TPA: hypothetical protein DEP84_24455 [Chloroflexi bacterium]|nr:hypothetical protein [Chloroflexota bacterium]
MTNDNQFEMNVAVGRLVDNCVGENLDQLITMDMRGDGIPRLLMRAARAHVGGPLALAAAQRLHAHLQSRDRVLMLTGFIVPPWDVGETDGLIGTVVLGRALEVASDVQPVLVCEPQIFPPLEAGLKAAGMRVYYSFEDARNLPHSVVLLPFPKDEDTARAEARRLADLVHPSACIAVERPGRNPAGHYHFAMGRNVTEWIAPIDFLYEEVQRQGALTVAVGDFGNELGMGTIGDVVRAETPAGANCGCPCAGGTACLIGSDVTVACSVSDWGAYAIAAALAYLKGDPFVFMSGDFYRRVLDATVVGGCIDGTSTYSIPHIDGIREEYNVRLVEMLADVVSYPGAREKYRAIREFRVAREAASG